MAGRIAAVGAVAAAITIVAILLFQGGGGYEVTATFQNASQLVKGNQVEIGGTPAGSVKEILLTDSGQADIRLSIDDKYKPLPEGTQAVIRQASQSGIANRYVDLQLPPQNERNGDDIPDGGEIPVTKTTTAVDLDQLFNTLDPSTRDAIADFFRNSRTQFKGKEEQQRAVYRYLNPALSTASQLFQELNRDSPLLARFLQDTDELVTTVASRKEALTDLITNANRTFTALGSERAALGESIARLPNFMRQANTTFVNLRAALDDVDPLVNASKPVARQLRPFLAELRPLAHDANPTIRDLSNTLLRRGRFNDLLDLQNTLPALASTALDTKTRRMNFGTGPISVGRTAGAFPATVTAMNRARPLIAFGRPYTPELVGWFDDFSTSGPNDALGGFSRAQVVFNVTNASGLIPLNLRGAETLLNSVKSGQHRRCPGAAEEPALDGSNVWSQEERDRFDCLEEDRAVGPTP